MTDIERDREEYIRRFKEQRRIERQERKLSEFAHSTYMFGMGIMVVLCAKAASTGDLASAIACTGIMLIATLANIFLF